MLSVVNVYTSKLSTDVHYKFRPQCEVSRRYPVKVQTSEIGLLITRLSGKATISIIFEKVFKTLGNLRQFHMCFSKYLNSQ
jgi:hypothetical protein